MKRLHFVQILPMFLAACAAVRDPGLLPKDAPLSTSGIVIISTGASEKCYSTATFLRLKTENTPYNVGDGVDLLSVDVWVTKSDFEDHQGKIYALNLIPGKYYLAPYIANPQVTPIRLPRYDFTVSAGEVIYLGEYYLTRSCSWGNVARFSDQSDRDLPFVKRQRPELDVASVKKRIASATGLAVGK